MRLMPPIHPKEKEHNAPHASHPKVYPGVYTSLVYMPPYRIIVGFEEKGQKSDQLRRKEENMRRKEASFLRGF